ncbi:MAG: AMP-binding protein [Pseudomonadota bacterium]
MLVQPMQNYWETVKTYNRPPEPETYNYADVIDGYAEDPEREALVWANADGAERRLTFRDVSEASKRVGAALKARGVKRGDRVLVMLPRIPDWQITMIAIFRIGAVAIPCITMSKPGDLKYRIDKTGPKAVVTIAGEAHKFDGLLAPDTARLALAYGGGDTPEGWDDYDTVFAATAPECATEAMRSNEPCIIYFTSGSTGMPKGVTHSAFFARAFFEVSAYWFDLNAQSTDDTMWGTADTGWSFSATATLIGPWLAGVRAFTYDGPFDPKERLRLLERYEITIYAAAASEFRWILGEDIEAHDLSKLRLTATAGESLDGPTADAWMTRTGTRIHEAYGQTESLMTVGNFPVTEIKPGAMGLPLPGWPIEVISEDTLEPVPAGTVGHVALRMPSPTLMLGYWNDPEMTEGCFQTNANGVRWFITGDLARRDEDGYFWYEGRSDDVINAAGYRIGPAEVESAVMAHDAVKECAAVASPDPHRGVVVKAFIVVHDGVTVSDDLAKEIQDFVKSQTAPYKYPRKIEFLTELPRTVTGKVRRRDLRDLESTRAETAA